MSSHSGDDLSADDSLLDVEKHIREIETYLSHDHEAAAALLAKQGHIAPVSSSSHTPRNNNHMAQQHGGGDGSNFSTPSTISSASARSSRSRPSPSTQAQQPAPSFDARAAYGVSSSSATASSSGAYSPRTAAHFKKAEQSAAAVSAARTAPAPAPAAAPAPASLSNIPASTAAANKERIVQQLLQQHRQAQATGRASAATLHAPPSVRAQVSFSTAAKVAPAMLSTKVVLPARLEREQRDELVERLLQERRKQKEKEAAAHTTSSTPKKSAAPVSALQQLHATHAASRPAPVTVPPVPAARGAARAPTHAAPSALLDESGDHHEDSNDSATSPHSLHSRSHSSLRSDTSSPIDPRFAGHSQTIFDASEYINEDGSLHTPHTQRSRISQVEEDETSSRGDESRRSYEHNNDSHRSTNNEDESQNESNFNDSRYSSSSFNLTHGGQKKHAQRHSPHVTHLNSKPSRALSRSPVRLRPSTAAASAQKRKSATASARKATRPSSASNASDGASAAPAGGYHFSNRYSRAAVAAEIERERAELHTFAPTFISKPLLDDSHSMEERLDVWRARQAASLARRLEQKKEYEEEKFAECTFTPAINPSSKKHAQLPEDGASAAERLHHEADQRAQLRERARRLNEEDTLAALPFAPQIAPTSRKVQARVTKKQVAAKPLYQRVAELQKRKNEHMQSLLLQSRDLKETSFKPQINPISEKLAKEREEKSRASKSAQHQSEQDAQQQDDPTGALSSRLSGAAANASVTHKLRLASQHAEEEARTYTFKPELNAVSEKLLKESRLFAGEAGKDFLTRQQRIQLMQRQTASERMAEEAAHSEYTFKPDIGNAERILAASKKRHAQQLSRETGVPVEHILAETLQDESPSARAERLSSIHAREIDTLKQKLTLLHQEQSGYTFVPEISAVSRKLAEQRAAQAAVYVSQGLEQDGGEKALTAKLLKQKLQQEFEAEHPFQPTLNATSVALVSNGLASAHYAKENLAALTTHIREQEEERELHRAQQAKALEQRALKECTFEPLASSPSAQLGQVPKPSTKPILIRGMNRFLQLKEMQHKQQQELMERKKKVFFEDVGSTNSASGHRATSVDGPGYTVPQPFTLSHETRAAQRAAHLARVAADAKKHALRECSFAPVTIQAQNRQLIQHILASTDEVDSQNNNNNVDTQNVD